LILSLGGAYSNRNWCQTGVDNKSVPNLQVVADAMAAYSRRIPSGSDTAAIGGDFAYGFGRRNSLANIGATPAQFVLASAVFATAAQARQPAATLYSGTVRLN
jgi:hypothetical protein